MDHDRDSNTVAYASLIQTFNRYLLEQMTVESESAGSNPSLIKSSPGPTTRSPLAQLLKVEAKTTSTCQQCNGQTSRDSSLSVIDMVYPRKVSRLSAARVRVSRCFSSGIIERGPPTVRFRNHPP